MNEHIKFTNIKNLKIIVVLFILAIITYIWTINLPIIGDGLMHLNDHTELSSINNILKSFYTFNGLEKPANTSTIGFHRPIFNEFIVEAIKYISSYNIYIIRFISILAHSFIVIIAYLIGLELFQDRTKGCLLAIFMNFSLTYFAGIYEFGLSFSLWLTLFVMLSFFSTIKYVKYHKKCHFIFSLIWTFFSLYTKESAMTLGIALSFYVFANELQVRKKITSKTIYYGLFQATILIIYLITRYIKLGSVFVAATGIDSGGISPLESIYKVIGYFLYSLNIPSKFFTSSMCTYFDASILLFAIFSIMVPIVIAYKFLSMIKVRSKLIANCCIYMGMYILLIIPVFKVSRNSTYYGDILVLFILLILISMFDIKIKSNKLFVYLFLFSYTTIFISNVKGSIKTGSEYYLSVTSNDATILRDNLKEMKNEIETDTILLSNNWLSNYDKMFIYNHNGLGSFYKYNVDMTKNVNVATLENIYESATMIDYFKDVDNNELSIFVYPNKENNTKLVQIDYNIEKNDMINLGFYYKNKYYYSSIDTQYKKNWSTDNSLFFVIPKESTLDIDDIDCKITYIGEEQ